MPIEVKELADMLMRMLAPLMLSIIMGLAVYAVVPQWRENAKLLFGGIIFGTLGGFMAGEVDGLVFIKTPITIASTVMGPSLVLWAANIKNPGQFIQVLREFGEALATIQIGKSSASRPKEINHDNVVKETEDLA